MMVAPTMATAAPTATGSRDTTAATRTAVAAMVESATTRTAGRREAAKSGALSSGESTSTSTTSSATTNIIANRGLSSTDRASAVGARVGHASAPRRRRRAAIPIAEVADFLGTRPECAIGYARHSTHAVGLRRLRWQPASEHRHHRSKVPWAMNTGCARAAAVACGASRPAEAGQIRRQRDRPRWFRARQSADSATAPPCETREQVRDHRTPAFAFARRQHHDLRRSARTPLQVGAIA